MKDSLDFLNKCHRNTKRIAVIATFDEFGL